MIEMAINVHRKKYKNGTDCKIYKNLPFYTKFEAGAVSHDGSGPPHPKKMMRVRLCIAGKNPNTQYCILDLKAGIFRKICRNIYMKFILLTEYCTVHCVQSSHL
jgi:hypothetical protein